MIAKQAFAEEKEKEKKSLGPPKKLGLKPFLQFGPANMHSALLIGQKVSFLLHISWVS